MIIISYFIFTQKYLFNYILCQYLGLDNETFSTFTIVKSETSCSSKTLPFLNTGVSQVVVIKNKIDHK